MFAEPGNVAHFRPWRFRTGHGGFATVFWVACSQSQETSRIFGPGGSVQAMADLQLYSGWHVRRARKRRAFSALEVPYRPWRICNCILGGMFAEPGNVAHFRPWRFRTGHGGFA